MQPVLALALLSIERERFAVAGGSALRAMAVGAGCTTLSDAATTMVRRRDGFEHIGVLKCVRANVKAGANLDSGHVLHNESTIFSKSNLDCPVYTSR